MNPLPSFWVEDYYVNQLNPGDNTGSGTCRMWVESKWGVLFVCVCVLWGGSNSKGSHHTFQQKKKRKRKQTKQNKTKQKKKEEKRKEKKKKKKKRKEKKKEKKKKKKRPYFIIRAQREALPGVSHSTLLLLAPPKSHVL